MLQVISKSYQILMEHNDNPWQSYPRMYRQLRTNKILNNPLRRSFPSHKLNGDSRICTLGKITHYTVSLVFKCDSDHTQERWRGVLHHVCNVHEWYGGECEHDALTEPPTNIHGVLINYFTRGESDYALLQKIVTDKTWMKSLKYFTRFRYS